MSSAATIVKHGSRRRWARFGGVFPLLLSFVVGGCAAQSNEPENKPKLQAPWSEPDDGRSRKGLAFDPCADRLHELCRPLLMHYALYRRMPGGLDELRRIAGPDPALVFECPESKQTYAYDANGLLSLTVQGRIVLYDSSPAHDGKRWAVVLEDTRPGQPLIPRVVAIPEREFPPRARDVPTTQPAASE